MEFSASQYSCALYDLLLKIQGLKGNRNNIVVAWNTFVNEMEKMDYCLEDFDLTKKYALKNVLAALLYHDSVNKCIFTRHQIRIGMGAAPMYKEVLAEHPNMNKMRIVNIIA